MKILIAGGGIGGLSAALCLAKIGCQVQVFEQAPEFAEVGAGLQCGANALHVLDHIGIAEKIRTVAVEPERAEFKHYKSGETLHRVQFGKQYASQYHAPYLHIHRADLLEQLVVKAQAENNISLHLGTTISAFREHAEHVAIDTHNGESFSGDVLVAADGVKSILRKQLMNKLGFNREAYQPVDTGHYAWRGVIPRKNLPDNFMDKIVSNFVGPKKHMVIYYLRASELVNFVGVVERPKNEAPQDESWTQKASWQGLQSDFSGWHPTVQKVIDAADKQACFRWDLFNHRPLQRWSSSRITLLGDAAHATLPFMAAGAAMAIEDARILARCLESTLSQGEHFPANTIRDSLQQYQHNRISRTAKIQKTSELLGKLYHINNSLLLRSAFWAIRHFGKSREDFLPHYNANTVVLSS